MLVGGKGKGGKAGKDKGPKSQPKGGPKEVANREQNADSKQKEDTKEMGSLEASQISSNELATTVARLDI